MKNKILNVGRWVILAVFLLSAGVCYSCGVGSGIPLQAAQQTEGETPETADAEKADAEKAGAKNADAKNVDAENADAAHHTVTEQGMETARGVESAQETTTEFPVPICYVHVCGEVVNPGVYVMQEGQRIYEAIARAGGFADGASTEFLNLAEPVCDGMKILVPSQKQVRSADSGDSASAGGALSGGVTVGNPALGSGTGETGAIGIGGVGTSGTVGTVAGASAQPGKVNLNTATKEELMTLRGIGEARAEDIIRYRQERGGFSDIEQIMEVSGIKDAAFQKIKDDIMV